MKKLTSLQNKTFLKFWIFFHAIIIVAFCAMLSVKKGINIDADLFNMLPKPEMGKALNAADEKHGGIINYGERAMARIFLLKGDIANPGYVDIPEDATTIREVIYDIGGGIPGGKKFKAVQIGGPSGGLLTEEHLDLPLQFTKLKAYGVRRGDSVITVLDEDRCMVDVAARFMEYTQTEFCGKCVPCREGTKRMDELLWGLKDYRIDRKDFTLLQDLGEMISVTAFCNLGKNSFHTLETAIKYFPKEFEDHLKGECALCELDREPITPGGLPYNKIRLVVDPSICRGCSKCARNCHADAITGVIKSPFSIDPEKCVKCYTCIEACPFDAIREVEIDG